MQARINLRRCFFVASQLNNPKLLGVVLLYFLIGVSPFACFKAVVLRGRRINYAEVPRAESVEKYYNDFKDSFKWTIDE